MRKLQTLTHPLKKRINDIVFVNLINPHDVTGNDTDEEVEEDTFLFAGTEDGKILVWSVEEDAGAPDGDGKEDEEQPFMLVGKYGGHTNRLVNCPDFQGLPTREN